VAVWSPGRLIVNRRRPRSAVRCFAAPSLSRSVAASLSNSAAVPLYRAAINSTVLLRWQRLSQCIAAAGFMVSAQNAVQTAVCLLAPKRPTLRRNETGDTVTQRIYRIVRQIGDEGVAVKLNGRIS
jgi:hypothetical protein